MFSPLGMMWGTETVENNDDMFSEKMRKLTENLGKQMAKRAKLDPLIRQKLGGLEYEF